MDRMTDRDWERVVSGAEKHDDVESKNPFYKGFTIALVVSLLLFCIVLAVASYFW